MSFYQWPYNSFFFSNMKLVFQLNMKKFTFWCICYITPSCLYYTRYVQVIFHGLQKVVEILINTNCFCQKSNKYVNSLSHYHIQCYIILFYLHSHLLVGASWSMKGAFVCLCCSFKNIDVFKVGYFKYYFLSQLGKSQYELWKTHT